MFPFVTSKCSRRLACGVDVCRLDFWEQGQFCHIDNPKNTRWGSGNVSHCWTSTLDDHLNHSSVVLKKCTRRLCGEKKLCVRIDVVSLLPILFFQRGRFQLRSDRVKGCSVSPLFVKTQRVPIGVSPCSFTAPCSQRVYTFISFMYLISSCIASSQFRRK